MKNKILSSIACVLMLFSYKGMTQSLEGHFQKSLDSLFDINQDATGVLMHIEAPNQGISWTSAIGIADRKKETTLSKDQAVLIASNTKPYVAATILRLVEMGKIDLDQPIDKLLSKEIQHLFSNDGYDLNAITIRHLLSHTSGISDYVDESYFDFVNDNPQYHWKKEEQLQRTIKLGCPLFSPGSDYNYGDINYLLLTEIIESQGGQAFYEVMRKLLKFDELGLSDTWFKDLEDMPISLSMAHQYAEKYQWDSSEINPSWDLYGGGGLAATVKDAALFFQYFFEGKIVQDVCLLEEATRLVLPKEKSNYCLGFQVFSFPDFMAYYHGGWWGTDVAYCPETNSSIAVFTLEKAKRGAFARLSIELMERLSRRSSNHFDTITTSEYSLFKVDNSKATLVLFPGGANTSIEIQKEFDILSKAHQNKISVLMMNFNRHLWLDDSQTSDLAKTLESIFDENELSTSQITIGGMSVGGNVALSLANFLIENQSRLSPKGAFMVDAPIDLYALYQSSIKDIKNVTLSEERLEEPKGIVNYLEYEFGKDSLLSNIQKVSPFTSINDYVNIGALEQVRLRFYTEPDSTWYKENRQTDFESTNAYTIQQISKQLQEANWTHFELIETQNKGYRSDGQRHPHSWSIVDVDNLMDWLKNCVVD